MSPSFLEVFISAIILTIATIVIVIINIVIKPIVTIVIVNMKVMIIRNGVESRTDTLCLLCSFGFHFFRFSLEDVRGW